MNTMQSIIPMTENCIIALNLNFDKVREHVVIGELNEVQKHMRGNKQANILAESRREIGDFIKECFAYMPNEMADLRIGLTESLVKKETPLLTVSIKLLEEMYRSDNLCHRFLAIRLWREYHGAKTAYGKRAKSGEDREYIDAFVDRVEDLTLPYRFSIEHDIMKWQCDHPKFPLRHFGEVYHEHPCGLIWSSNLTNDEYGFATVSLLPILMYGLRKIYDNHLYFQHCKLCGRLFLAKTANIPTYCGEGCKRESVRLNKKKFDSKAKTVRYERQHKNAYMYWYNKVKKLQKDTAVNPELLERVEAAFEKFKAENMRRKTAVKDGRVPEKEYTDWLYEEQGKLDNLMK